MTYIPIGVLIICGVVLLGWNVKLMARFSSYCERVAEATGRLSERQSANTDDGGLNLFDREQFFRLMRGDYGVMGDHGLFAEGQNVARRFWLAYGVGALFIVALVLVFGP